MPFVGRARVVLALLAVGLAVPALARDDRDPLARARQLYNQRQFDGAIAAADQARTTPTLADAADLLAARALLERFRVAAAADDLVRARTRLARLDPQKLQPADRIEFLVGLGESLYLDHLYGAAAELFGSLLTKPDVPAGEARERMLDWWAAAVDRDAKPRASFERPAYYQRIRQRMQDELGQRPGSSAAAYWAAAAAHGQGDVEGAWSAAQAGWVRASLAPDHGVALRADLDKLVRDAVIPDRSKALGQPADVLKAEWERYTTAWQR